jgi:3-isopropylmalate/(R)-2-methylmalate dehydratase small subunit
MDTMKNFSGKVLFLDRADINTDEIIAAKYLSEITREALKPHLFEDLQLDGFRGKKDVAGKGVIITRTNFGCGSSREHAPWALAENDIHLVVAESFARIFKQNMFNCGLLTVELPATTIDRLFRSYAHQETTVTTDLKQQVFKIAAGNKTEKIQFSLPEFARVLVKTGGWVEYADSHY